MSFWSGLLASVEELAFVCPDWALKAESSLDHRLEAVLVSPELRASEREEKRLLMESLLLELELELSELLESSVV
jgi:hypothetical protein